MRKRLIASLLLFVVAGTLQAQQLPLVDYSPPNILPSYSNNSGPRVAIDDQHHNFHTADGRYRPFAELLRRDGYRVNGFGAEPSTTSLSDVDVLVIVNALNERNKSDWSLPTPSAFSKAEIEAVRCWVCNGGSLLLIADHMPFPGAASELGRAFMVEFSNGYVRPGHRNSGVPDVFNFDNGLCPSSITNGRTPQERVTQVATFSGSAFVPPIGSIPIILLGPGSISAETTKAPGITPEAEEVPVEGWCQGAVFYYGAGRVAVFGEAAMFTAQVYGNDRRPMGMNAPAAKQNHQLLLNVMHWLSHLDGPIQAD